MVLGFVDLGRMLLTDAKPLLGVAQWWCLALVAAIGFAGVGAWWQLDRARPTHPDEAVDGARSVLRILVLFALVTPFWSLFDQKASTWVLQAERDDEAELVRAVADAGAQPAAGDAADPVQQPGALPRAAPARASSRRRCAA